MAGDRDDRCAEVIAVAAAMIFLSTLAVILRWWPRLLSYKADFWYDDYMAFAALPFALALNGVTIYWASIGLGKHLDSAPLDAASQFFTLWITNFFYTTSLAAVKISVLLFYGRVFRTGIVLKLALWMTAFLVVAWWMAIDVLNVIQCQPISAFWYRDSAGTCVALRTVLLSTAAPNVVTDTLLLILPLPILWKLPIGASRRLVLSVVFMLGYCVLVVSITRLVLLAGMDSNFETDLTWNVVPNAMLLCLESSIAIISICLPRILNMLRKGLAHLSTQTREADSPIGGFNGPAAHRLGHLLPRRSGTPVELNEARMELKPVRLGLTMF